MKICIISDDYYFSTGVEALLKSRCRVERFSPQEVVSTRGHRHLEGHDRMVVNIYNRALYRKVSQKLIHCSAEKIILLRHWNRLSKRIRRYFTPVKITPAALRGLVMCETLPDSPRPVVLNESYFEIYQKIIAGADSQYLADSNDVTYKRVFYMKKVILAKLGLEEVSPTNVFLAESVFLGFQGRNQVTFTS